MKTLVATVVLAAVWQMTNAQTNHPYLDDADRTIPPDTPAALKQFGDPPWPRVSLAETKVWNLTDAQIAKYGLVTGKLWALPTMRRVKEINPSLIYLYHLCPTGYQAYNQPPGKQGGMPFAGTGPSTYAVLGTTQADVFAGHWLYKAGTLTTKSMTGSTTTVTVSDPGLVTTGQYVVIYDAPAGSFKNAEHAKVNAVNMTTKVVTLERGYYSDTHSHPAGAIMAQHALGPGSNGDPRGWAYNQSTACPRDASGKTFGEAMASFLAANINRDYRGQFIDVAVDGVLNDSDSGTFHGQADVDNNLVNDNGIIGGRNAWSEGLDRYYAFLRSKLPGKLIIGGSPGTHGYDSLAGEQEEEWPTLFKGSLENNFDANLADYGFDVHQRAAKLGTHCLTRDPSHTYWESGTKRPADNQSFRFSFGAALLDNGFYGKENSGEYPDVWYDEYAVDVVTDSARFGQALAKDDPDIFSHLGWMGYPLEARKRLYDDATFAAANSLITNGGCDEALTGWTGTNVRISSDSSTGNHFEGKAALKVSGITSGGRVEGPSLNLAANTEYTVAFAVKAEAVRSMTVRLGGASRQTLVVPDNWQRRVITLKTQAAGKYKLGFVLGDDTANVWIDSVYLFPGNTNVFSREFDNALVIVNATSTTQTVDLGGTYWRIKGTQDPVNDGSQLHTVSLGAWDAAILVKPPVDDTSGTVDNEPTGACGDPKVSGATDQGTFLWLDCGGSNRWHLRVGGGGTSTKLAYHGTIQVAGGVGALTGVSLEASDLLDTTSDPNALAYTLNVWNNGIDGFDFTPSTNACFRPMSPDLPLYLGANRVPVASSSLNLTNLKACDGTATTSVCGEPTYSNSVDRGTFIWKDCGGSSNQWHLRVIGGSTPSGLLYEGTVASPRGLAWTGVSIEDSDLLDDTTNPDQLSYQLNIWNNGQDGIDFIPAAGGCYTPIGPALPVYVGAERVELGSGDSLDLDLDAVASCR